jgi:broad specificity phosphatase PhoE
VRAAEGDQVLLIRHAATTWSGIRYCGRSDPPLSRSGRAEAERLAMTLPDLGPGVRVIASPLRRAVETAGPIALVLGSPVEIDERWRETDFGDADGLTFDEVQERWPDLATSLLAGDTAIDWPLGERHVDLVARVASAWADVTRPGAARRSIVVSHGGPIRVARSLVTRDPGAASVVMEPGTITPFTRTTAGWRPGDDFAATLEA